MSKVDNGRELLKKAIHMATSCLKYATPHEEDSMQHTREPYESRLWNLACSYVHQARDWIPPSEWHKLTSLEQKMLQHNVPYPMESKFFDEEDNNQHHHPTHHEPLPWETIQTLQSHIRNLESEKDQWEEYKTLSQTLRDAYQRLDQQHDSYREHAQREQNELQRELKRMIAELETASDQKQDIVCLERELTKMREKIANIHTNSHKEITQLRVELDTSQYERESLALALQETQTKVMELTEHIRGLQTQIEKYQEICQFLIPAVNEDSRDQLRELLQTLE